MGWTYLYQVGLRWMVMIVVRLVTATATGPSYAHDAAEQKRHGTANTALFRMRRTAAHGERENGGGGGEAIIQTPRIREETRTWGLEDNSRARARIRRGDTTHGVTWA